MALGTGRSRAQLVGKRQNRVQLGIELSQLLERLSLPVMAVVLLLLRDFLSTLSRSPRSAIERRADRGHCRIAALPEEETRRTQPLNCCSSALATAA
jgi:hypothetical protein